MVNQAHGLRWFPVVNSLLQCIQDETGLCRCAYPPADDLARMGIDDESDIDKALPGSDIGEIADPKHMGCVPLTQVFRLFSQT